MQNTLFPRRQIMRFFPTVSGLLLFAVFVLAARGGAQSGQPAHPRLRVRAVQNAVPPSQADAGSKAPTGKTATDPLPTTAKNIDILSPANATIYSGKSAVYRITINPDDAALNYYVMLDYDPGSTPHDALMYIPGPNANPQPLPAPILFAPGVTHVDVTVLASGTTPARHTLYAYQDKDFKPYPSAPLTVTAVSVRKNRIPDVQGTGGQTIPISAQRAPAVQGTPALHTTADIFTGGAQPIPISCLVPYDPIQADSEGFDCVAGVDLLGPGAGALEAENAGEKRRHKAVTRVLVDCSLPTLYRPGKGLIASRKRGSNGWPATLRFTDRRQQTFAVEPRAGTKNKNDSVQLMFYQMPSTPGADPTPADLIFTKSVDITAP